MDEIKELEFQCIKSNERRKIACHFCLSVFEAHTYDIVLKSPLPENYEGEFPLWYHCSPSENKQFECPACLKRRKEADEARILKPA